MMLLCVDLSLLVVTVLLLFCLMICLFKLLFDVCGNVMFTCFIVYFGGYSVLLFALGLLLFWYLKFCLFVQL